MSTSRTPTVSFRWDGAEELDKQLPDDVDRSEAMRRILDNWVDDPDESLIN